jgi:hypothetical protein
MYIIKVMKVGLARYMPRPGLIRHVLNVAAQRARQVDRLPELCVHLCDIQLGIRSISNICLFRQPFKYIIPCGAE